MNETVLLVAAGEAPGKKVWERLIAESPVIIAADGGANICYRRKIYPHFIVGDLDSLKTEVKDQFHDAEIIHRPGQSQHDLEKALRFAATLKPAKIIITAATGGRTDHMLANIYSIFMMDTAFPVEVVDDFGTLSMINRDTEISVAAGTTISFFSFSAIHGLDLKGFAYDIDRRNFEAGLNGLSNRVKSVPAQVKLARGRLLMYILHE